MADLELAIPDREAEHYVPPLPDPPELLPALAPERSNEVDDNWSDQGKAGREEPDSLAIPGPLIAFPGISQTNRIPPDPVMAVGPTHLMAAVNADFAIFSKAGTRLLQVSATDWFRNVLLSLDSAALGGPFDPQLVYDHFSNRWILVYVATNKASESWILISVSDTSDPTGGWCNHALRGDENGSTASGNWADFPGLGFDSQAVYLTFNQYRYNTSPPMFEYSKVRIISKSQLYQCVVSASYYDYWDLRNPTLSSTAVGTTRPAVTFGGAAAEYLLSDSPFATGTHMTLWTLTNPLGTPSLSGTNVPVTASRYPPDADQLGGSAGTANCPTPCLIDVGDRRILSLVYRDGSLWATHTVAGGLSNSYSRARYVRIAVSGPAVLEDQSFGLDGCWYFYPTITCDTSRNIVMLFGRSCTNEYAGLRFTARTPADSSLQASTLLKAGEANYVVSGSGTEGKNRWGDYFSSAVDPTDGSKIWMVGEYAAFPGNRWGTYIGQVVVSCSAPPIPTAGSNSPIQAGQTLQLTASSVAGATYSWTGPNGFTSTLQNPVIPNASPAASGTYFVSASLAGCTSLAGSTVVVVTAALPCFRCPRVVPFRPPIPPRPP